GRIFDRQGVLCRALLPRTGVRKGGHLLVKWPHRGGKVTATIEATFEVLSEGRREVLAIDYLDIGAVAWHRLQTVESGALGDGWTRIHARGVLNSLGNEVTTDGSGAVAVGADTRGTQHEDAAEDTSARGADVSELPHTTRSAATQAIEVAIAKAAQQLRSPVTIESVTLEVQGEPTLSVPELQPFVIKAAVAPQERTPGVSVHINVIRSDGAYVFCQPSGLDGKNIADFEGRSEVVFHFDPNPFGAGEYEVNLFAVNAFSWDNIPPSEIYDRSIGKLVFRVHQARPI